jgi:hypothetical protein
MIKRWSSKFGKDKDKNGTANGTSNGVNGRGDTSNGVTSNGVTPNQGALTNGSGPNRRTSSFGFSKHEKNSDTSGDVNRKDIEGMFQEFAQIIHASKRPLPNQNGDGTYNGNPESK